MKVRRRGRKGKRAATREKKERDGLFESGPLWKLSVSMATIKIGLHALIYRRS